MARFMTSIPDEMVRKLDEAARREHRSRSEFFREAVRHHLAAQAVAPPKVQQKPSKTAMMNVAKNECCGSESVKPSALGWIG